MNLRNYAEGKPCLIRVPLYCIADPATTVLAHFRMLGVSGMGLKSPDLIASFACSVCHDIVDGRKRVPEYDRDAVRLMHLEGVARTLAYLIDLNKVKW